MAEFFLMPAATPTMEVGKLISWRVKEGDKVSPQDVIAEIETDKATMEIEVFDPGFILKILEGAGSEVPAGAPIAIIGGDAGEDISEMLREFETKPKEANTPAAAPEEQAEPAEARTKAGPAARKTAEELGIDLGSVHGTGPGGRVMRHDVEKAVPGSTSGENTEAGVHRMTWQNKKLHPAIIEPLLGFTPKKQYPKRRGKSGTEQPALQTEVIENSMMRKTIAKRLKASYLDAPVFFLNAKFNCDNMYAFRQQLKQAGIKVSYNDITVKAVARALREVPAVNASWGPDAITRHGNINVGVAVALPDGLITPVIRNADSKSLPDISTETRDLATRAKDLKLKPEEYQGSTFTVSNLGMMGIEHFTAIINPPNSAILAVGSMQKEPVVVDDELSVGWRMKVTMTCDHRVIDGALGATFLASLRKYIENPLLLVV